MDRFKAEHRLLALSIHGDSVMKYRKALMERRPTDLGAGDLGASPGHITLGLQFFN